MLGLEPQIDDDVLLTDTILGKYSHIQAHSVLHQCTVGDYSYCAGYNQLYYTELGKFCSLASFVRINPGNHPTYQRIAQHHFTYRSEIFGLGKDDEDFFAWRRENAVKIGHDVWIGHNACVMPGITIGNGAVIGSGAIVTKNVEPYTVVVGVPAHPIKKRFSEDVIEKLEALRWWDWDHETLREGLPYFRDFTAFKAKFLS